LTGNSANSHLASCYLGTRFFYPKNHQDPGESRFSAAIRETEEEMGYAPGMAPFELEGIPMNPNSAFFETPWKGEGVRVFALPVRAQELEQVESVYRFRPSVLSSNEASKSAKLAEQILGSRFVSYVLAVRLGDMFTVAAVGRLRGHLEEVLKK
jgi:hypothetical protein